MANDWMPGVNIRKSQSFTKGRAGNAVKAVVLHIAQGSYAGSISWLIRPSGTSAHFIVSKQGDITQMVSINDMAWANGISYSKSGKWIDPPGNVIKPSWVGLTPPINPNYQTISIEAEGFTTEIRTDAMDKAIIRILQWLSTQVPALNTYTPHVNLIGHNEISPKDRPNCPGIHCDFDMYATQANSTSITTYTVLEDTGVYQGPADTFPQVRVLPTNTTVEIDQDKDGWMHLANGEGFFSAGNNKYSLFANPGATQEQCLNYMLARKHGEYDAASLKLIISYYFNYAVAIGFDPVLAIAQMIHETGNLTSALSQREDRNGRPLRNPAGLAVTGQSSPTPKEGYVWDSDRNIYRQCAGFSDWRDSVKAHLGHLLNYALLDKDMTSVELMLSNTDPRKSIMPANWRGTVKIITDLNKKWAIGDSYGQKIISIYEGIRNA